MLRILIADDDLVTRLLLSEGLADYGSCDSVVDGAEAVRAYRMALQRDRAYDLICLDIMMPKVTGQEALKKIREIEQQNGIAKESRVIVIMVTALVDELNKKMALDRECDGYVTKPIEFNALSEKLKELSLIEK